MVIYKLLKSFENGMGCVLRDGKDSIPFDPANTDYANFKRHLQGLDENGNSIDSVELQDADGNTMSPEEVAEFLATLP